MARKTLDSIKAAIGKAPTMQDAFHSVDVRAIDNGYIVRESKHGGGEYKTTEYYSPEKPGSGLPEGENLMKRAVDYMNKPR